MAEKGKDEQEKKTEQKAKSAGIMKTVLMVGLPLILLQTGLAYYVISKFVQTPKAAEETKQTEKADEGEDTPGKLYIISDVIVNPAGTGGSRFLNASIAFEYTNSGLEQEFNEKDVQIRDILINILAGKTIPELDGPEDKEALRKEIREKCNAILKKGKIRRVYFSNFVMQ